MPFDEAFSDKKTRQNIVWANRIKTITDLPILHSFGSLKGRSLGKKAKIKAKKEPRHTARLFFCVTMRCWFCDKLFFHIKGFFCKKPCKKGCYKGSCF